MSKSSLEFFAFFPARWMGSESVQLMTLEERGVYITLLCHAWENGSVPADPKRLARVLGVPAEQAAELMDGPLGDCWEEVEGRLVNARLEAERDRAQGLSEKRRSAAKKRWESSPNANAEPSTCKPDAHAMQVQSKCSTASQPFAMQQDKTRQDKTLPSVENSARARAGSASALEKALRAEPGLPDPVVAAAHRWVAYRRDAKLRAWAAATWASNLAKARTDPHRWVAAVAKAIDSGWQGVFPEKVAGAAVSDPKRSAAPKPYGQLEDEYRRSRAAQIVSSAGADDGIVLDADGRPILGAPKPLNGARPRLLGEGA